MNYYLAEVHATIFVLKISAVCRQQTRSNLREATAENMLLPLTLICDNIKDAGTLGTLIRSAAAACCKTVLITRGNYYVFYVYVMHLSQFVCPSMICHQDYPKFTEEFS